MHNYPTERKIFVVEAIKSKYPKLAEAIDEDRVNITYASITSPILSPGNEKTNVVFKIELKA